MMLLYDRAVVLRAFMIGYIALRGLLLRKSGLLRLRVYGLRRGEGINRLLIGGLTIGHLPLLRREDPASAAQADGAAGFPAVLPQVQAGNRDQRPALPGIRGRQQTGMMPAASPT